MNTSYILPGLDFEKDEEEDDDDMNSIKGIEVNDSYNAKYGEMIFDATNASIVKCYFN